MTKINIKMIHGFSGGIIISSFCLLLFVAACSQNQIKCQYQFQSLATGIEVRKDYFLSIEENKNGYRFNYYETSDSIVHYYETDNKKNTLILVDNNGQTDIATAVGVKHYILNDDSISVTCYWANNEDKLAENLLLFYNQDYGVFLLKYTSSVSELTYFEGHTPNVKSLINMVKNDSVFYYYGGRKILNPPSL